MPKNSAILYEKWKKKFLLFYSGVVNFFMVPFQMIKYKMITCKNLDRYTLEMSYFIQDVKAKYFSFSQTGWKSIIFIVGMETTRTRT